MFNMISKNIQNWNNEIHKSQKQANTNAEQSEVKRDPCIRKEKSQSDKEIPSYMKQVMTIADLRFFEKIFQSVEPG